LPGFFELPHFFRIVWSRMPGVYVMLINRARKGVNQQLEKLAHQAPKFVGPITGPGVYSGGGKTRVVFNLRPGGSGAPSSTVLVLRVWEGGSVNFTTTATSTMRGSPETRRRRMRRCAGFGGGHERNRPGMIMGELVDRDTGRMPGGATIPAHPRRARGFILSFNWLKPLETS